MTTTTTLLERLTTGPGRRDRVLDDCVRMIDEEVASKGGLMSLPLKAAYKVVKGVRPGFVRAAMDFLLDDFCRALEPFYRAWADTAAETRAPLGDALRKEQERVADALLSITDARAARSTHTTVRALYEKLRGAAKGHVVAALPRLGRTIEPYLR